MIRTASKSAAASKGKIFYFGPCALGGFCSAVALVITLLRLIQELETSEITTRSNSEHQKKKNSSLTAAWVAPQVGLLSKDMWKEMKEIASL